ncbi:MAG: malto-oligosyltrehalose synthase [Elusimicrobia bacterium]|nr:malto-oligosyltrehalose synthase [Elusimicrobiota bacterium]
MATAPLPKEGPRVPLATRKPVSTYRFQLNKNFTFRDAEALIPYLADLGITDVYTSPLFMAVPGSMHGYDICDHSRLNPELGSEEDFDRFCGSLRSHHMGLVVDFVPNHVGAHPSANAWWRDVLENGPSSPFATYFDIDFDPVKSELKDKLLLPILGDQYGRVLERGELKLEYARGVFSLAYFDNNLPINPRPAAYVLNHNMDALKSALPPDDPGLRELLSVHTALLNLPPYTERSPEAIELRAREKTVCRDRLAKLTETSEVVRRHIEDNVRLYNEEGKEAKSFDLLHTLLESQPYRLAYWRTALDEINYRRFFDINELAGLRQEVPEVFDNVHKLLFDLIRQGKITGLRLDHIDGLHDPAGYLEKLQARLTELTGAPLYVVVEKITSAGEILPDWPVDGTTGYDFLNDVNGLFIEPRNALLLKRFYARFSNRNEPFSQIVYQSKYMIMVDSMISELTVLAHRLNRDSEKDRQTRDFTLESLRRALREIVAAFPIYRTYVDAKGWSETDAKIVDTALARTRQRHPTLEPTIMQFIRDRLLPPRNGSGNSPPGRSDFAMRFQQYTAPVQAKGFEDTAFYRYNLLLSLNEVGGDPNRFGRSLNEFHENNRSRRENHPTALLSTATHDTKRGEDARARLNVLSEIPMEWRSKVMEWARMNAGHKTSLSAEEAPDRNDEYFFYQALLGFWPAEGPLEDTGLNRLKSYLIKALREAKTKTSWVHNNEPYESAMTQFAEKVLTGPKSKKFIESFLPFQKKVAFHGMLNALSQVVLKHTSPGIPDLYQGCEFWDLSLADPDNRRPVDFVARGNCLKEVASPEGRVSLPLLLNHWWDGKVKFHMTSLLLRLRKENPDLFLKGDYTPLHVDGPLDENLVAFSRQWGEHRLIVAVARRTVGLGYTEREGASWKTPWSHTRLVLPREWPSLPLTDLLTGRSLTPNGGSPPNILGSDLFQDLPVAVFLNR